MTDKNTGDIYRELDRLLTGVVADFIVTQCSSNMTLAQRAIMVSMIATAAADMAGRFAILMLGTKNPAGLRDTILTAFAQRLDTAVTRSVHIETGFAATSMLNAVVKDFNAHRAEPPGDAE